MTLMVYFISKIYKKEGCNIMDFLDNILKNLEQKCNHSRGSINCNYCDLNNILDD